MRADGAIAQLGERCNRTAEVVSSNLIGSTKFPLEYSDLKIGPFEAPKASHHIATNQLGVVAPAKVREALELWLSGFTGENTCRTYRWKSRSSPPSPVMKMQRKRLRPRRAHPAFRLPTAISGGNRKHTRVRVMTSLLPPRG